MADETVYILSTKGNRSVYHTDPECQTLAHADHNVLAKPMGIVERMRVDVCKVCASEGGDDTDA